MKRLIPIFLLAGALTAYGQTTGAPLNLNLPVQGSNGWGDKLNQNATTINSAWAALPTFPTANGIVYRASSTLLQPATASNVVALWTSCTSGYLAFDGTCSAPTYAFSQITGVAAPSQLPVFAATANGIVPQSGGGTANYLRADGTWAAPPGGGTNPTANGIQTWNTTAWAVAAYGNVVSLFGSGTCSGYLKNDGTCSTPNSISGLTTGYIPQATSATAIGNSFIDYGVTNAGAYTVTKDLYVPVLHSTDTSGAGFGFVGVEGSALTGAAGSDAFWADLTAHRLKMNNNNAGALTVVGIGTAGTAGHIAVFATGGNDLSDGGPKITNVTVTLPTTAIAANACTVAATVAMTGVATTSAFSTAFASDPSAVVGWGASGGLSFKAWPTANTLNWEVCNNTAASITPGAMSLNVGAQ